MAGRFSIGAQIAEVEREIRMRERVYPNMRYGVGKPFHRKSEADLALEIMRTVRETLQWNRDNREAVIAWIRDKKPEGAA